MRPPQRSPGRIGRGLRLEICILAGGRSRRMGRDKARLTLGRRTVISHLRVAGRKTGWPVRVIRRDLVPGLGPLGGVFTALKTTDPEAILFLACDMPLIRTSVMRRMIREFRRYRRGSLFLKTGEIGFPFVLSRECMEVVERRLHSNQLSLQGLAKALRARTLAAPAAWKIDLLNANSPAQWKAVRLAWRRRNAACQRAAH